jgi:hypothetical protein
MFIHPNADLWTVINHEGMQAHSSYVVYDEDHHVYAFDAIGSQIAVKAIKAGMLGRSGHVRVTGGPNGGITHLQRHDSLTYTVQKHVILQEPNCHRWHMRVAPRAEDPFFVIWGTQDQVDPVEMFYRGMQQLTRWPIVRPWAPVLFETARELAVITDLSHTSTLSYAYQIPTTGWERIYNARIHGGHLRFDHLETQEAA